MPPQLVSKKTRSRISDTQKKEICEIAKKNPSYRHQEIAQEFTNLYPNLKIDRSTVTKILKQADEYNQLKINEQADKTFRHRSVKHPRLELAMNIWVEQVTTNGFIISDSLIKE